jgi:hypothetical protein
MKKEMPIFVKVEKYEDVLDTMNAIKAKVNGIKVTLGKINEIKNNEDAELELWQATVEDIEKKMLYADGVLLRSNE